MSELEKVWHREVITTSTEETIAALSSISLGPAFYLAGGTGLGLHLGHRRSIDLDFFSTETVDEEALLANLNGLEGLSVFGKSRQTLEVRLSDTKVSFMGYPYPLLCTLQSYMGIEVADARDIACMKLSAIAGRGTKRDFFDFFLVSKKYGLSHLLELFHRKFAAVRYNTVHILKSLTYFEDAEKDPPPDLLMEISWEEVKRYFTEEAPRLV